MKAIKLTTHAKSYFDTRGFSEEEVQNTIQTSDWITGELGKLECRKNFEFKSYWNKKFYEIKQIRPIFVEEDMEIVVITVYTYYF
ncbi:MAG: hypothetical protein HW421_4074 [Ignavibacteria bacterium]|nr:hypothetical protein [Ignavibacteria bacterium]